MELSRPQDAKKTFDKILQIAPGSKVGSSGKSSSMLALGEINEALGILREAASARELAAVFNTTAILAIRKGNYEAGMNLYKVAMDALGDRPKVLARLMFNMGIGFHKWEKPDESLQCFQQALKLDGSFADAAHNLSIMTQQKSSPKPDQAADAKAPAGAVPDSAAQVSHDMADDGTVTSESVTLHIIGGVSPAPKAAPDPTFATDLDGVFDEDDF